MPFVSCAKTAGASAAAIVILALGIVCSRGGGRDLAAGTQGRNGGSDGGTAGRMNPAAMRRAAYPREDRPMAHQFTTSYLEDSLTLFRMYKKQVERAVAQVRDEQLFATLGEDMNSIAIVMKHMAGNMRSRWTDFLTTDGEKPDRNRDSEFEDPPQTREALMAIWENGWKLVFGALEPLTDADLTRSVSIRGEPHSVMQAINRQIGHYAMHSGQVVLLARYFAGDRWQSLSIPRGQSAAFNQRVNAGETSQR